MFSEINDESFNAFVRFAYYTGARSGEIRRIAKENVLEGSFSRKRGNRAENGQIKRSGTEDNATSRPSLVIQQRFRIA